MEAAFVYGTVHQFVLTTEATLLRDTGYVQRHTHPQPGRAAPLCCLLYSWFLRFPGQIWDGIRVLCRGWTVRSGLLWPTAVRKRSRRKVGIPHGMLHLQQSVYTTICLLSQVAPGQPPKLSFPKMPPHPCRAVMRDNILWLPLDGTVVIWIGICFILLKAEDTSRPSPQLMKRWWLPQHE